VWPKPPLLKSEGLGSGSGSCFIIGRRFDREGSSLGKVEEKYSHHREQGSFGGNLTKYEWTRRFGLLVLNHLWVWGEGNKPELLDRKNKKHKCDDLQKGSERVGAEPLLETNIPRVRDRPLVWSDP